MGKNSRYDETTNTIDALLDLKLELDLPLLCLWQLSREVEREKDRRPGMHHLRDSGAIEEDVDKVWLFYREAYYARAEKDAVERQLLENSTKFEVINAKARGDRGEDVTIRFDPGTNRFWAEDETTDLDLRGAA